MQFFDKLTLGDVRVTGDGYLIADVRAARTGIQLYAGREVGKPAMDTVRVYRPEAEVFHQDAMSSFTSIPVTLDHPPEAVGPSNWQKFAKGFTGESVARDGGFIRVPLALKDQSAISAVQSGKRELSCGYTCDLKWEAGTTPEGEAYDAIQTNIRGNHLAIVGAGRAGSDCRIGDEGAPPNNGDTALQKLVVDGITVEMPETAAQVVTKVLGQLSDATADVLKKDGEITALKADHAQKLQAKDGEITALKAQIPDAATLDARAAARVELIGQAKKVLGDSFEASAKSDADIRRDVVNHALGDAAKDMTDAHIEGAFKVAVASNAKKDPVRDALLNDNGQPQQLGDSNAEYQRMLERDAQAWKKGA